MFQMSRGHVNSHADLKIIGGNPIVKVVKLLGRIQLKFGYQHHIDSSLRMYELKDTTSWMFGAGETTYQFFKLEDYITEHIKDYDGNNTLLSEWITLDPG
jgi:hypothetical protein